VTALPQRRRNRTLAMLAATVLVAASVPALGYVGVKAVLDSTGGRDATADNLPVQSFPATPAALYLTTDADGLLSGVTVMVLAPSGAGGSIVTVPVNTDVGLTATARRSLQQVFAEEGADGMGPMMESLLLVTINVTAVADPAQLTQFLTPYEPLTVELVNSVPDEQTGQGDLAPGTAVIQAATAAAIVTGDAAGDQSARQANIDAVWAGLVASVATGRPPVTPVTGQPTTFEDFTVRLFSGRTQSRGLTVTALTGAENPDDVDVVQMDKAEAVLVFASIAPGSMASPALGPKLRLEAPPGYDVQVQQTIKTLQFLNANIISVDTTAEPHAETTFLVPDESNRALVQATDEIFGDITFVDATVRIDNIDATIVLGTDYLDGVTS
jgi:hypothetical protein